MTSNSELDHLTNRLFNNPNSKTLNISVSSVNNLTSEEYAKNMNFALDDIENGTARLVTDEELRNI